MRPCSNLLRNWGRDQSRFSPHFNSTVGQYRHNSRREQSRWRLSRGASPRKDGIACPKLILYCLRQTKSRRSSLCRPSYPRTRWLQKARVRSRLWCSLRHRLWIVGCCFWRLFDFQIDQQRKGAALCDLEGSSMAQRCLQFLSICFQILRDSTIWPCSLQRLMPLYQCQV